MKQLLLIPLCISSLQLFSQSKFSLGLLGSLDAVGIRQSSSSNSSYYTSSTNQQLGYQFSVRGRYDFNKNFSLQSGICLISYQTSGTIDWTSFARDVNFIAAYIGPKYSEISVTNKMLQVPLLFSSYVGNKVRFGLTTGLAYNIPFYYSDNITNYYANGNVEYLNGHSSSLTTQNQFVSGIVGVGAEYRIKSYSIRVEPTGTYQLFYISDLNHGDNRLWSIGLNLSTYYHF